MSAQQPPLQLKNYFVEKLEYEALPGFDPKQPPAEELTVDPDVFRVPNKPDDYMVRLRVSFAGPPKSNSRCRLSFGLVGFFSVSAGSDDKVKGQMVFSNAPLILFGIARQVAAEVTGNGPYGKVILPTVNFVEILKRKTQSQPPSTAVQFKASDKPSLRLSRRKDRV